MKRQSNIGAVAALLSLIAVIMLILAGAVLVRKGQDDSNAATIQYWNKSGTDGRITLTAQIGVLNTQSTVTFEALMVSSTKTFAVLGATSTKLTQTDRLLDCYDKYLTDRAKLDLCKSTGGWYEGATPIP